MEGLHTHSKHNTDNVARRPATLVGRDAYVLPATASVALVINASASLDACSRASASVAAAHRHVSQKLDDSSPITAATGTGLKGDVNTAVCEDSAGKTR